LQTGEDIIVRETRENANPLSLEGTRSSFSRGQSPSHYVSQEKDNIHVVDNFRSERNTDLFAQSARLRAELSSAVQFTDTLEVNDFGHTHELPRRLSIPASTGNDYELTHPARDMIQNVNFDINNFISNARIIQDSINEAMAYTQDLDPNLKEELFRSDLKMRAHAQDFDLSLEKHEQPAQRQ